MGKLNPKALSVKNENDLVPNIDKARSYLFSQKKTNIVVSRTQLIEIAVSHLLKDLERIEQKQQATA